MSVLVSAAELRERLATRPRPVVLDATVELPAAAHDGDHRAASGHAGWLREHLPGSRHADLLVELSDPAAPYHFARPTPAALAAALARLGVVDGVPVVVYDTAGGIWAARLWWLLDWIGVPAQVLDGGLAAWRAAGHPVATGADGPDAGAAVPAAGRLTPRVRSGRWVERDDLRRWLAGDADATVVCALGADAYRGDVPTRYTRRGHLPGSGNLPARALVGPDGRYLPGPELRAALGDLLADPRPVWLYCGGGISAAALGVALAAAGRADVALYDGSLEEWSADPALPLTRGDEPAARLDPDTRALLDRPEFAVLSTTEPDGRAQLSVMWVGRDGDHLVMATKDGRRKVRNIRRDPRVTVLVYDRARPTRYVEIRGRATVTDEDAHALIDELARSYTGAAHVTGTPEQEAGRVVLRITPDRVRRHS
ncbi:TIGR03618 family F420-dependent PPOX class oxidoreductase [Micromonospora haikouensis]|uniref:TIGR03618 family F420-dependent PPOX class oxidoreductase n=1 Tax=Micromonospora haikouensis TaxID=686309 RepID=UPI0033D6F084